MSSESDPEEFYDAFDVTPGRIISDPPVFTDERAGRNDEVSSALEEEERKLLEAKRKAEERRKKDEEEIERQLAEIKEKKKAVVKKATDNDQRKQRFEQMKKQMMEDSPTKSSDRTSLRFSSGDLGNGNDDLQDKFSQMRQPSDEDNTSPVSATASASGGRDSRYNNSANNNTDEHHIVGRYPDTLSNLNILPEMDKDKVASKNIPELMVVEPEQSRANPSLGEEPDIVKSVSKSLERNEYLLPEPVAPPRKRKKKPAPLPPDVQGSSSIEDLDPSSDAGSNENLSEYLDKSLDLKGAISGDRVVTAREDASAKAGRGSHEPVSLEDTTTYANDTVKEEDKTMIAVGGTSGSLGKEDYAKVVAMAIEKIKGDSLERGEAGSLERPRTNSGSRFLTDKEILDKVRVLNLDTGEEVPLSLAEDKLPRTINPLSLHIMRRTKEYSSDSSLHKGNPSDDETLKENTSGIQTISSVKPILKKRATRLSRLIGKAVHRKKKKDNINHDSDEDDELLDGRRMIKIKASSGHKGPYDFDLLVPVQDLSGDHNGAVWTMKFSHCGRLLATGGQDNMLRIWVLKSAYSYFNDMRKKYCENSQISPAVSYDSVNSQSESIQSDSTDSPNTDGLGGEEEEDEHAPFMKKPFCLYKGHTADLLDMSWSKNMFVLSSSMDKTVRLWHIFRKECLCCFQHIDFVTAIAFHPKDDRYFLSGSLDGKLRLWNIPEKKVAVWNEVSGQSKLITAANFCSDGKRAVVGTYDGRCIFYTTEQLKYFTQIHVRSTRGKNARGRKITGIESMPGEDKIMVTSNDSRIRLYDLRDLTLTCKYKGCANNSSQIKASFSHNGKYIVCGSEDHFVYIWRTHHMNSTARRDRNDFWEGIKAHTNVVTAGIFAPNPDLIIRPQFQFMDSDAKESQAPEVRGEVLVSADFGGAIKVFINKFKPGSG